MEGLAFALLLPHVGGYGRLSGPALSFNSFSTSSVVAVSRMRSYSGLFKQRM
jgi:hypothetical protein